MDEERSVGDVRGNQIHVPNPHAAKHRQVHVCFNPSWVSRVRGHGHLICEGPSCRYHGNVGLFLHVIIDYVYVSMDVCLLCSLHC